jgi:hypothetical protein
VILFLLGLSVGVVFTLVWQTVLDLLDIYAAERDRDYDDDPRKPW